MQSFGIAFLKAKLPRKLKKPLDLDQRTVIKPKFRDKGFRETRPDIVYKVPIRGTDEHLRFYVIIEHQSLDDHSAIFQLWGSICQLCRQWHCPCKWSIFDGRISLSPFGIFLVA